MKDTQTKLISALVKEELSKNVARESALKKLMAANIVDKNGKLKKPYSNKLKKIN